jgi:hypothetical protein
VTRISVRRAFALAVAIGFSLSAWTIAAPSGQTAQATPPAIFGAWQLNSDASDKPPATEPAAGREGGGRRGGFGGRGRGGMGGGMRGGGMRGGRSGRGESMAALRDAMRPTPRLTISGAEGSVLLTDADGQVLTLATNGKKEKHVLGTATVATKTKWDGPNLVIDFGGDDGFSIVRTYSIVTAETGRHLQVVTKIGGRGGNSRTVTHVYDPVG